MQRPALSVAALLACAALLALGLWWPRHPPPPVPAVLPPPSPATPPPVSVPTALTPPAPPVPVPVTAPTAISRPPPPPDAPAKIEAEAIALDLRHFGQRFGGNPVGTNAEIVRALNGGNPQGARYLPPDRLRLNDQGELLDTWGTPYFFHQLSAQQTEIRSAGPDKKHWTSDDIVAQ